MRYALVIDAANNKYSAYVPDLLGCVATGKSVKDAEYSIREAIEFHLEGLGADNLPILPGFRHGSCKGKNPAVSWSSS